MPMTDWPTWADLILKLFAALGGLLGTIGGMVALVVRNTFVTKTALQQHLDTHDEVHNALNERLAEGEKQFAEIKADLAHLPTRADISEIKERIGRVEGDIKALSERIEGHNAVSLRNENLLTTIHQHLLLISGAKS